MEEFARYLAMIRKENDKYGYALLDLMDYYHVNRLVDLTVEQLKKYCEEVLHKI